MGRLEVAAPLQNESSARARSPRPIVPCAGRSLVDACGVAVGAGASCAGRDLPSRRQVLGAAHRSRRPCCFCGGRTRRAAARRQQLLLVLPQTAAALPLAARASSASRPSVLAALLPRGASSAL